MLETYITEPTVMRKILDSLVLLRGGKIQAIWTMGLIFDRGRGFVELDEPIVLIIDGIQFEMECLADNIYKIGVNTLTMKEKSYQGVEWSREVEELLDDAVGRAIIGAEVRTVKEKDPNHVFGTELPEQEEYIKSVDLIMDSGKRICFTGFYDYMHVYICNDSGEYLYGE